MGLMYQLMTGKYTLPKPADPTTLLARYETSLLLFYQETSQAIAAPFHTPQSQHHKSASVSSLKFRYTSSHSL